MGRCSMCSDERDILPIPSLSSLAFNFEEPVVSITKLLDSRGFTLKIKLMFNRKFQTRFSTLVPFLLLLISPPMTLFRILTMHLEKICFSYYSNTTLELYLTTYFELSNFYNYAKKRLI